MMIKIFNRRNTVVFTVLLIVSFIAANALLIARTVYSGKVDAIVAAESGDDGEKSELSDKLVDMLSGLLEKYAETEDEDTAADGEKTLSPAAQKYASKMKVCLGFSIALYALTVIFIGMDIACAAYDSYLKSDKYKAKLRNQRIGEKRRANMAK